MGRSMQSEADPASHAVSDISNFTSIDRSTPSVVALRR